MLRDSSLQAIDSAGVDTDAVQLLREKAAEPTENHPHRSKHRGQPPGQAGVQEDRVYRAGRGVDHEKEQLLVVPGPDAVRDENAVVVHSRHACAAPSAVVGPARFKGGGVEKRRYLKT